jgi:hypothetical protein
MSSWPAKWQTAVFIAEIDMKFEELDEGMRDPHALCVNFPETKHDLRGCLHPGSTTELRSRLRLEAHFRSRAKPIGQLYHCIFWASS